MQLITEFNLKAEKIIKIKTQKERNLLVINLMSGILTIEETILDISLKEIQK